MLLCDARLRAGEIGEGCALDAAHVEQRLRTAQRVAGIEELHVAGGDAGAAGQRGRNVALSVTASPKTMAEGFAVTVKLVVWLAARLTTCCRTCGTAWVTELPCE